MFTGRLGLRESRLGKFTLAETAPTRTPPTFLADWSAGAIGIATVPMISQFNRLVAEDGGPHSSPTDRIVFSNFPVRQGSLSLKMTVKQHDVDGGVVKERVQITSFAPTGRYYLQDGEDVWIAMSFFLAENFVFPSTGAQYAILLDGFPNTSDLAHSGQNATHEISIGSGSGEGPVWRLNILGGVSSDGGATYPHDTDQDIALAKRGQWSDFLMHVRFSTGGDGLVEIWYAPGTANASFGTGAPTVVDHGPNIATANGYQCVMYPEPGIYRSTQEQPSSMYLGGVAINTSRTAALAAVLPEIHSEGQIGNLPVGYERFVVQPEVVTIP